MAFEEEVKILDALESLIMVKAGTAPGEGMPRVSDSPTDIRDRFRTCFRGAN